MILQELANALGLEATGNLNHKLSAIASIESATTADLSFVVSARFADALKVSHAGAVIIPEALRSIAPGNYLVSDNPYAAYAQASWVLKPASIQKHGIHESAVVDASARISNSASIGPGVVIGADTVIGDGVVIGAHCVIGNGVSVGMRTYIFPRVTLYDNISIGNDCRFQSGTVIGSEGFGYAWTANGWSQIQQTGGVRIGNRVHVGANTTIDCGAIDPTVIADGVIMDNQIQIAHNVQIGENTAIAGCVGVAGSTKIGANCQIGGACNIVGHLSIADGVVINAASLVARSIVEAGRYGSGTPLQPDRIWRRSFVNLSKLDDLFRRLRRLERLNRID
jgi:UDP-3-O-[3-hydroxymyristoyl] glucosamine N-acyltransferase